MAKLTFGPGDDLRRRRQIRDSGPREGARLAQVHSDTHFSTAVSVKTMLTDVCGTLLDLTLAKRILKHFI